MQGISSRAGNLSKWTDYDITLAAQTGGVDNWQAAPSMGANAYAYSVPAATFGNGVYISSGTSYMIWSNAQTIHESTVTDYSMINSTQSTDGQVAGQGTIDFVSLTGKPVNDIPLKVRIFKGN